MHKKITPLSTKRKKGLLKIKNKSNIMSEKEFYETQTSSQTRDTNTKDDPLAFYYSSFYYKYFLHTQHTQHLRHFIKIQRDLLKLKKKITYAYFFWFP